MRRRIRVTGSARVRPFEVAVPDDELIDLARRLAETRFPVAIVDDWSDGTDLAYLRELVAYWRDRFDWRAQEARLNTFPQYLVRAGEAEVHCVHVRGNGPAPLPLVITHGWPGSYVEMLDLIPRLTDPERFGGDARDAFHVVVPSLPGYGFSSAPARPGTGPKQIAAAWVDMMGALGYERFAAQGGDWGAAVSTHLGIDHPEHVVGVHLNYVMRAFLPSRRELGGDAHPDESAYYDATETWAAREGGYAHLQGTKPQTLAYALTDSPAGLAAYLLEKFRSWSDCGGDLDALYWFTKSIGSSMHLYWERERAPGRPPATHPEVPFAFACFPKEIATPPRRLLERVFRVERYTTMERGGHFAAFEEPERLAADVTAFFRSLRSSEPM